MTATVEEQRVMIPHVRSWMEKRAVCRDHGSDNLVPNWMGRHTHPTWIAAKIEAVAHNLTEHPDEPVREPTWDELLYGAETAHS